MLIANDFAALSCPDVERVVVVVGYFDLGCQLMDLNDSKARKICRDPGNYSAGRTPMRVWCQASIPTSRMFHTLQAVDMASAMQDTPLKVPLSHCTLQIASFIIDLAMLCAG